MKWRKSVKPTSQEGDTRTIQRFALWPHHCDDGYVRWLDWLEPVTVVKMYTMMVEFGPCGVSPAPWNGWIFQFNR